ncbi:MAG: tannase/feruloyl esterase family alpha/beta hydrolase [Reyranella sp.]|nr:tannase/feruloyl esterase family alpha/beta hydrolase [Reyranella sp.]
MPRETNQITVASLLAGVAIAAWSNAAVADSAPTITPALKCEALAGLTLPGTTIVIEKAEAVPEAPAGTVQMRPPLPDTVGVAIPSNCRAQGVIDRRVGAEGKNYAIGFAIALPDRWNGRFLYQGGGGLNGSIRPPLGPQAIGEAPALARGFAVISTDSGHQGAVFDAAFMKDQEAALNFAQASVGKVTAAAKAIIGRYYGQGPTRSYFVGCSTGGREGMIAAQRYPAEFDGIVAGAPAMRTGRSNLGLAWANHALAQVSPRAEDGKPDPTKAFSPAEQKLVTDAIVAACDAKDGLKDGMIFNVRQCAFDPASLVCQGAMTGAKTDACLSAEQASALAKAFAGPKNSRGAQSYSPFPWDSGIANAEVAIPGILVTGARSPVNPNVFETIDVDAIEDRLTADGMDRLQSTANWTNLNSFFGHGGKMLFYHGVSDPWFSALDTIDYYERMGKSSGGIDQVRANSSRAYLVPGMGHCQTGATLERFDLLQAVVDWVEKGKAPESVIATGPAFPGRSRPLCAWPQYAAYKGQGNPEDAGSFECRD